MAQAGTCPHQSCSQTGIPLCLHFTMNAEFTSKHPLSFETGSCCVAWADLNFVIVLWPLEY